jgi:hypothetical protein
LAAYVVGYRPLPVTDKSASAATNVPDALKQLRSAYGDSHLPILFNCALHSQDDHLVKMVYTCWREFTYSGNVDFWVAAQMAARQQL